MHLEFPWFNMVPKCAKGLFGHQFGRSRLQAMFRALGGIPPVDKKLAQFLLNDRKVLRFKVQLGEIYENFKGFL